MAGSRTPSFITGSLISLGAVFRSRSVTSR